MFLLSCQRLRGKRERRLLNNAGEEDKHFTGLVRQLLTKWVNNGGHNILFCCRRQLCFQWPCLYTRVGNLNVKAGILPLSSVLSSKTAKNRQGT